MKTHDKEKLLNWLQKEIDKDNKELEREKMVLINEIKRTKKDTLVPKKEKLSIWQRMKKVLMGI